MEHFCFNELRGVVLLEKLIVAQAIKKFPVCYCTRWFVIVCLKTGPLRLVSLPFRFFDKDFVCFF
jgi:hypothetical protein